MLDADQNLLAEQLKELGFSTDFTIPTGDNGSLIVYYKNIAVVSPFYKSLVKTTKELERKLSNIGVDQKTAQLFITYFTNVYLDTKNSEHLSSINQTPDINRKKKVEFIYKYSKLWDKKDKTKKKMRENQHNRLFYIMIKSRTKSKQFSILRKVTGYSSP